MPKFNVRRAVVSAGLAGALAFGGTTIAFAEEAPVATPDTPVIATEAPADPAQAPAAELTASAASDAPATEFAASASEVAPGAASAETASTPEALAALATPVAASEDDIQVATDPDRVQVVFHDYNGRILSASDYLIGRPLKNWPVTPSRPGYEFLGFAIQGQEDQGVVDPETYLIPMGIGKLDLVAQYAELATATFNAADGSALGTVQGRVGSTLPSWPDAPSIAGKAFVGYAVSGQEDQGVVDPGTYLMPAGGVTFVAVYKDAVQHDVIFHNSDGSVMGDRLYTEGETLEANEGFAASLLKLVKVPAGGKLLGWATTPDALEALPIDTPVTPEMTDLYPVIEEQYLVTFHNADGSVMGDRLYVEGDTLEANDGFAASMLKLVKVPAGGTLLGWGTEPGAKETLALDTLVTSSMKNLYPVIQMPLQQFHVTFHGTDGSTIGDFLYDEGMTFNAYGKLDDMAKLLKLGEGDTFLGWGTSADATETVSGDAVVTAGVTDLYPVVKAAAQQFHVTFHGTDGSTIGDFLYDEGDTINAYNKADDMAKLLKLAEGETFLGWAATADATEALANDTVVTSAITDLYPVVQKSETPVTREYTVTFQTGTDTLIEPVKVKEGETVAEPQTKLEREGYTFAGWFLGEQAYDFSTPVTSDITLTAQWTKNEEPAPKPEPVVKYTVTFDSNGGSPVESQLVEKGTTATKPTDPTREGYTFGGWYLGENPFDFEQLINGDITLTAKWVKAETPSTPDNPGTTTPDNPTKPGEDTGDKPADKPADKNDGKKDTAKKNELPKTGDETNAAGVAVAGAAGVAALGAGALILNRRKREQN